MQGSFRNLGHFYREKDTCQRRVATGVIEIKNLKVTLEEKLIGSSQE